ncbi:MAG TPA: amino acid ABC transporter permease [Thermoplasmata archaeon]|nr:amino acid ABC transporter permease [Thermoplasmata archaeon]
MSSGGFGPAVRVSPRGPTRLEMLRAARGVLHAAVAVGAAVGVFLLLGLLGVYDLPFIFRYLPSGVGPAVTSLVLTTLSFLIGFALALPLAVVRAFPPRGIGSGRSRLAPPLSSTSAAGALRLGVRWLIYGLVTGYVQAVRGTPFLVQVFLVYYGIIFAFPRLSFIGLNVSFWAGLIALTINTTGYQAEALRGGFQSVELSQVEAGRALGMTRFQIFRRVTLPQGIRLVTLPLTNEWISNFKTSAILSYIAVVELFFWSRTDIAYQLARPVDAFVMIAIFYLVINVTLSRVVTFVEYRRRIPGLGSPVLELAPRPA